MKRLIRAVLCVVLSFCAVACDKLDNNRIPPVEVYLPFSTVGVWDAYGVTGAMDYRRFVKSDRIPGGYPYSAMSGTGFGGILLVRDYLDTPVAYDLACPVEVMYNVRVEVDDEQHLARCPKCGSTYFIFENYGHPVSGPAKERGYGLECYRVLPADAGFYMLVRR